TNGAHERIVGDRNSRHVLRARFKAVHKNAPPAARGYAANSILDRGYGRPSQTINSGDLDRPPDQMTDAELLAIAAHPGSVTTAH
ncbi:MAG: hypothetical protein WCF50_15565, partial [Pseudolabrys sp.]